MRDDLYIAEDANGKEFWVIAGTERVVAISPKGRHFILSSLQSDEIKNLRKINLTPIGD